MKKKILLDITCALPYLVEAGIGEGETGGRDILRRACRRPKNHPDHLKATALTSGYVFYEVDLLDWIPRHLAWKKAKWQRVMEQRHG